MYGTIHACMIIMTTSIFVQEYVLCSTYYSTIEVMIHEHFIVVANIIISSISIIIIGSLNCSLFHIVSVDVWGGMCPKGETIGQSTVNKVKNNFGRVEGGKKRILLCGMGVFFLSFQMKSNQIKRKKNKTRNRLL